MSSFGSQRSVQIATGELPTAEQVAAVVVDAGTIGQACAALRAEGWASTIAGNRITVSDRVFVRFIDEAVGMEAGAGARWVVYGISDRPRVLVVNAGILSIQRSGRVGGDD